MDDAKGNLHIANLICFDKCVLLAGAEQLGEGRQQSLNSNSRDFNELARKEVLARLGAQSD